MVSAMLYFVLFYFCLETLYIFPVENDYSLFLSFEEGRWRYSKDDHNDRAVNKSSNYVSRQRDGRSQAKEDDNSV